MIVALRTAKKALHIAAVTAAVAALRVHGRAARAAPPATCPLACLPPLRHACTAVEHPSAWPHAPTQPARRCAGPS